LTASVTSGGSPVTSGLVNFCESTTSYCGDYPSSGISPVEQQGHGVVQSAAAARQSQL
jgi:hypothetical protein